MKREKTWKKRMFAFLVAVCMVFTLLPATAAAAEGAETEGTPAQLVKGVMAAQPNPKTMEGKTEELPHYQKNMGMISDVKYNQDSGTITVMANRSGMEPYNITPGPGWGTYYALVMNFDSNMTLKTENETTHNVNIKAVGGYSINESYDMETGKWIGRDVSDAKEFVPGHAAAEYDNPIVFWLNARDDERKFTLKYTDPATGNVTKQNIVVEIKDTSKLVDKVVTADPDTTAIKNLTEKAYYKKNMDDISSDVKLENGTITVTAKRNEMESYYRGSSPEKKKWYALVLDFKNLDENVQKIVDSNSLINKKPIEADVTYKIMEDDRKGNDYKPEPPNNADNTTRQDIGESEAIVFWLDAEKDTSKVTLYREITQNKTGSGSADPEGKTGDLSEDTDSSEAEPEVVYRALQEITINVEDSIDSIVPTITLDKDEATIKKGEIITLKATKTPESADVTWESDNEDAVMVSRKGGVVAGLEEGEATITATVTVLGEGGKSKTATCDITVIDNSSSGGSNPGVSDGSNPGISGGSNGGLLPQNADIALNRDTALIYAKAKTQNTVQLKAVVVGNSKKVTWKSLNPRIATVKNGKVTAKKAGKATITATANGLTAKCVVTVKNPILKLSKTKASIKKGKKIRIQATATPASKIKYKSNKKKVATVTAKGVVKGKKKGTAKITVTANGVKKTFTVKVK